jgi:hypothetical protein
MAAELLMDAGVDVLQQRRRQTASSAVGAVIHKQDSLAAGRQRDPEQISCAMVCKGDLCDLAALRSDLDDVAVVPVRHDQSTPLAPGVAQDTARTEPKPRPRRHDRSDPSAVGQWLAK